MLPIRDNIRSKRFPIINVALIIACVVVFVAQYRYGFRASLEEWAFRPGHLLPGSGGWPVDGLIALGLSMFMHGGPVHLLGNMLFLWVFGDNIEDRMGHGKYLVFYVLCGAIATFAHAIPALFVGGAAVPLVGASGAIAGVLGAYFVLFKHAKVRTLVFFFVIVTMVDLPAGLFLVIWLVLQIVSIGGGPVAYLAHIGGFAAGYLLVRVFADTSEPRPPQVPPPPRVTNLRIE
ncbi:MAG: rhomboid family intramembrane serine protease [Armatimonadia bacterium]|nr:rhomboid family intramembrane serine protease [Armatimonadia bacterium]